MESSDLHQQPSSSGLTRYRSAPSSYFANIIDREFYEHIFNRPSSPETERVFSKFINSLRDEGAPEDPLAQNFPPPPSAVKEEEVCQQQQEEEEEAQAMPSIDNEQAVIHHHQQQQSNIDNYASGGTHLGFYQSSARPPLPNQGKSGGNHSNLVRHSSSPAGLFSQINIENGYVSMRGMGTLGAVNSTVEEAKFSTPTNRMRLKNQQNYSSGGRLMSSIAEIGDKDNSRDDNPEIDAFGESHGTDFIAGFAPWDDSVPLSNDNVTGVKRFANDDTKPFSGLNAAETQNEARGQGSTPLAHQLSLPNTSAEMAAIEKFLQFSDSVPCKIRAKRGMATHPRSIAERVRRTKISERMRKLQDLVPNMDKQTNTADMLDLAVDYIKDLQNQVQTLEDCQSKCTCSPKPQQ